MLRIFLLTFTLLSIKSQFHFVSAQAVQYTTEEAEVLSEAQKVERLILYIRTLEGATFIRDNSEYKPEQAAGHLASKWEKHAAKVKTAEGFIMKLASESSSGTPYSIRFADGSVSTTREVLLRELRSIASKSP